jgi:hypothetical protein
MDPSQMIQNCVSEIAKKTLDRDGKISDVEAQKFCELLHKALADVFNRVILQATEEYLSKNQEVYKAIKPFIDDVYKEIRPAMDNATREDSLSQFANTLVPHYKNCISLLQNSVGQTIASLASKECPKIENATAPRGWIATFFDQFKMKTKK